jgi:hypothetical protein
LCAGVPTNEASDMDAPPSIPPPLRALFLSLEYCPPLFSGNGTYSRCIVRGLARQNVSLFVVSGRPSSTSAREAESEPGILPPTTSGQLHALASVPLPSWGRLDRTSAWREFADGCGADAVLLERVARFAPEAVFAVDWSGVIAWEEGLCRGLSGTPWADIPCLYLNFRVFTTSTALHAPAAGEEGTLQPHLSDLHFYQRVEAAAVRSSAVTVALCRLDALHLAALGLGTDPNSGGPAEGPPQPTPDHTTLDVRIVLPPLRSDIAALATSGSGAGEPLPWPLREGIPAFPSYPATRLLTSAVRLSPEKGAHHFADAMRALGAESLGRLRLRAFLCGSAPDAEYAARVRRTLLEAGEGCGESDSPSFPSPIPAPPLLASAFLGAPDMAAIFARTAINVHPALSDAYGMTIVEAAAFGAPSLVHVPGAGAESGTDAGSAPTASAAAAPASSPTSPASLFEPVYLDAARSLPSVGALRLRLRAEGAAEDQDLLGPHLVALARNLPPVGACDLLAPNPHMPLGSTHGPAVLPVDFTRPAQEIADRIRWWLGDRGGGGDLARGPAEYAAVAAAARARALAWTEDDNGAALAELAREVVGRERRGK